MSTGPRHRGAKQAGAIGRARIGSAAADPRWVAVLARRPDPRHSFVYAVRTTGVYAWPGSASRLPDPRNVEFFDSAAAAEAAGYRPSRRAGDGPLALSRRHARIVEAACRRIERAESPPALAALARTAGLSPYHFHRVFRSITGLTPRGYALATRAQRVRARMQSARSVTDAIYSSGFSSNGRFYAAAAGMLGMTPSSYRAGGARQQIRFAIGQCSLGAILVAQSERGLCAVMLGDDPEPLLRDLQDRFPRANLVGGDDRFEALVAQVVGFVEAPALGLDLPLDVQGTAFQQRVWAALQAIPAGSTASYAQVARSIGAPRAARAVAQACAQNKLAVAIPCHRVVRSDGAISGYRWGIERKRALLAREAQSHEARAAHGRPRS